MLILRGETLIYDSQKWKRELIRQKHFLNLYSKLRWTARRFNKYAHKIDLSFLVSAIIIRKLIESDKLSDDADNYKINVATYTPRKHIDKLHKWVEDGDYEWGDCQNSSVPAKTICNSLIHSYAYCPKFSEQYKLIGFFVASDFDRNKLIYEIELSRWIEYINFISSDSVCELSMHFNEKKSDYTSILKKRR